MKKRKIIVLTPVKNDAWILERFLTVCSIFADHILIADQNSTDGSLDIYLRFPKVTLIQNKSLKFNEADRQILLIETAREKFGKDNILLAIDSDEVLAADAMQSPDWQRMLNAKPGTVLYFEKPTLFKDTSTAIRYLGGGWPLGYVDDGAEHIASAIHSTRIPTPSYAEKLILNDIKFIHYALARLDAQVSKQRMYSMLENIKNTSSLRLRRRHYNAKNDFSSEGDGHEPVTPAWFTKWEEMGIDIHTIPHSDYYWYDYEALRLFNEYGVVRFAYDDIWDFDWEACRLDAIKKNYDSTPQKPIVQPYPLLEKIAGQQLRVLDNLILKVKKFVRR